MNENEKAESDWWFKKDANRKKNIDTKNLK
jgi:hypothetical protein